MHNEFPGQGEERMTISPQQLPTEHVTLKRLHSFGILKVIEDGFKQHQGAFRLICEGESELVILGKAAHVQYWLDHYDSFVKEIHKLPSSSAVGRIILGDSLTFAKDGEEWKNGRKMTAPLVSPKLERTHAAMAKAADWITERFLTAASGTEGIDDIWPICVEWAARNVLDPFIGSAISVEEGVRFVTLNHEIFFRMIQMATADNQEALRNDPELLAYQAKIRELTERALVTAEPDTMVAALSQTLDIENQPQNMVSLVNMLMGNLFGSIDNPATNLCWCLIHLARNPEVIERIQEEAEKLESVAWSIQRCPVTMAVVKESLRLTPVSPIIERTTSETVEIDGCRIDKGTNVIFSPWLIHRNHEYWENPAEFNIDRFLQLKRLDPTTYLPFGQGKRNCVGMTLSLNQLAFTLLKLCSECRFTLDPLMQMLNLRPKFDTNLHPRGVVAFQVAPHGSHPSVSSVAPQSQHSEQSTNMTP
ncbi:cytochrome P450 [Vibrio spartinae]|uniref:Epi-isozizaene 5-monooxygenase/(E)-beta-farnesene synthase n=1 Tax=Vibrio spartinae TaxID=1918945 RepID=A0A1N6M5I3_9VIBR|nr:cytochrome P450 [Vibrio spartinae]SIO94606.1 Epi-isozizaene 5-monooxygenase/(E)-beta-farnesene synthase [Vibrio spartinae]